MTGLLGRFMRPALLGAVAVVAILAGLIEGGPQLTRLGFAALIGAVLWTTAIGFALGTLRLVAGLAAVVVVFALTSVGSNDRNASDLTEYRALRSELEIELNLLRGTSLTNGEVLESLSAAEASAIRAQTTCSDLAAAAAWEGMRSQELIEQLDATKAELTRRIAAVFDAVEGGRIAVGLGEREPLDENVLCHEPTDETSVDQETSEEDTEIDLEAPASARARVYQREAQAGGDAVNGIAASAEQVFGHLEAVGFGRPSASESSTGSETEATDAPAEETETPDEKIEDPAEEPEETDESVAQAIDAAIRLLAPVDAVGEEPADDSTAEQRCVEQLVVSADFAQTLRDADQCVAGCAPGAADGTCTPQAAKRLLLLGFQAQLEALTADETITEAQKELAARLAEIRADIIALDSPVAIHTLALDGADAILGDAVQKFVLDDGRAARLGGWGWVVLVVVSIIGYRLLEIANDRRSPGPVAVKAGESTKETESKTLAATELVKANLTAANLQEPSPLPGGEAVSSVSTSPESASFENAVVRYVVNLFQTTAFPSRGVDLIVTTQPAESGLTPRSSGEGSNSDEDNTKRPNKSKDDTTSVVPAGPDETDHEPYRIMVKANRKSRNGLVFSHPFTGHCLEEVTNSADYFAAERLLDSGWTTPSWLVWSSQDGSALRAYQEAMIEKESPRADDQTPPPHEHSARRRLERAVRSSPGTGAALVALSHETALEGDFVASAHYLLLASDRHVRFLTAKYRLAVTLSMLASDLASFWSWERAKAMLPPAACGKETELAKLAWSNHQAGVTDLLQGPTSERNPDEAFEVTAELLLTRAIAELDDVIKAVRRPSILARACRQAERQYWLSLLRSPRRRSGLRAAAESARALAKRRLVTSEADSAKSRKKAFDACNVENEKAVERSRDDWLVRYNAACYEAARVQEFESKGKPGAAQQHRREALDHLRRARFARNGQQLSIEWALVDPDLVPLRRSFDNDEEWFGQLAATFQVDPGEFSGLRVRLGYLPPLPSPPVESSGDTDQEDYRLTV